MTNREITDKYFNEAQKNLNNEIVNDKELWYKYVVELPAHLQIIYTIGILNQQVLNGGFHQYFFNSYGQFAYLTVENLKEIGAYETANTLDLAVTKVNAEEYPVNEFREAIYYRRIKKLLDFDEDFLDFLHELDKSYYSSGEDLEQMYVQYLQKNGIE